MADAEVMDAETIEKVKAALKLWKEIYPRYRGAIVGDLVAMPGALATAAVVGEVLISANVEIVVRVRKSKKNGG